ncbi:MAG: SDR family oxidoreductase [Alphaproteobacteria bacterium]|jgi:NAD(P)-dependent dehydrogenase (short-subunit alcohol dehydrogenase family)|nr:SDR family oxidoreductase [Alphaproteobacteria bacterium]MDP6591298.1 SDR family oxidoreductase [Alphaproteobacteria bacterium]MDP6818283.1 SDR family oxidoreductase [Alphaproteobacteria bacterium]
MDLGLKGRKAIVTGGTKGIGRAIAELLADEGCDVGICARNGDEVVAAVAALKTKGVQACGSALDVRDGAAVRKWVADCAQALGGLDIVVPNVSALAIERTEESWRAEFEVDLLHTVNAVEAAQPMLEKSDAGSIVIISSISGIEVDFAAGPYGAFKAALIHYAKSLACELAGKNIRVNSVSPGTTYFEGGVWEMIKNNMPDLYNKALGLNKMGRMATAEEVANASVFLASPIATFITGTNLVVDGTFTNRVQY